MFFSTRPNDVLAAVARHSGLTESAITGPHQSPRVVAARWLAIRLLRDACHMSLPEIGLMVGRDHSSIVHQLKRQRPELEGDLAELGRQL